MEQDEIEVAGHTVAIWCRDPEAREQIEQALAPLGLRLVAVTTLEEIRLSQAILALFYRPPFRDAAFIEALARVQAQRRVPAIKLIPRAEDWMGIGPDFGLFDDYVIIPYDPEEVRMRVQRNIQRPLWKAWLASQPPADG